MSETDQDEEEKKRRRYIVLALLVLLLLLLCLGGVLYWLFAIRPGDNADPDPSATSSAVATETTTTEAPTTAPTTTAPTTATTTTEAPATTTPPAPTTITIPTVIGSTVGEAVDALENAGFTNIKVVLGSETGQDVTGNAQYDGSEVIGVNPAQGTAVVGDTQIILVAKSTQGVGSG